MCGALVISKDILDSQSIVSMGPMALGYRTSSPNIPSTSSRGLSKSFSLSRDNVLEVETRDNRERQEMIQVCILY
jgi:hypothetical protein